MIQVTRIESSCLGSNTYIVEENGRAVIIDAGANYNEIKREYSNIDNIKIMGILLTHSHFDHMVSLDELMEKFNCPAYVSSLGKDFLYTVEGNLSYMGEREVVLNNRNVKTISDGEVLDLIDTPIKVIFTKGHCKSCVSYLIQNSLFTGDFLFYRTIGRTDLPYSSVEDMVESLKKIKDLKNFEECFAGHSRSFDYYMAIKTVDTYIKYLTR